jgi:hypothetical protein
MKYRILIILLAAMCAVASASGQSIRTLGYNTTNGEVVYSGTNTLTFTNNFNFSSGNVQFSGTQIVGNGLYIDFDDGAIGGGPITLDTNSAIAFQGSAAATTLTNLGLPLPALTQTSNVLMMRALAGSTNTNEPFSGTFSIRDENSDTRDISVSNGIILQIGTPY